MPDGDTDIRAVLRLALTPGLGPVRTQGLLDMFGSAEAVLGAGAAALARVRGIGPKLGDRIARGLEDAASVVDEELERMAEAGVRTLVRGRAGYPSLLAPLPDAPLVLFVRGRLGREPGDGDQSDRFPVAIVGSRGCTSYGVEQAERFGGSLGRAGLTVVSGGARGIDTAAHRGCLRAGGRTVVVLGCGLGRVYPEENGPLFERIVAEDRGAVISELPMLTEPRAENFPARNRLISGLSLGVLVIEAGRKSGALITARLAAEQHGREVLVVPGRVDSPSSAGSLDLLKSGGGLLVTEPGDVVGHLEGAARFEHDGLFADRYPGGTGTPPCEPDQAVGVGQTEAAVLAALESPRTVESLQQSLSIDAGELQTTLTLLELSGHILRSGSSISRTR